MNPKELTKKYISEKRVMQVATSASSNPWICSVYYAEDEKGNLYWLSLPSRRHSEEIANNPSVAVAIVVNADQPVVGVQIEGEVSIVNDAEVVKSVMERYVIKHGSGKEFYQYFVDGKNQHKLYKLTPKSRVLFDEVNFAGDPRKVVDL